jgi:hypothetical protein
MLTIWCLNRECVESRVAFEGSLALSAHTAAVHCSAAPGIKTSTGPPRKYALAPTRQSQKRTSARNGWSFLQVGTGGGDVPCLLAEAQSKVPDSWLYRPTDKPHLHATVLLRLNAVRNISTAFPQASSWYFAAIARNPTSCSARHVWLTQRTINSNKCFVGQACFCSQ